MISKIVVLFLTYFLKFIQFTNKKKWYYPERETHARKLSKDNNYILAIWHQNLLSSILMNKVPMITMASSSKDGNYAAQITQNFKITTVRGSSSKGGKKCLILHYKKNERKQSVIFADH